MVASNSINESTTGVCGFTGTAFTGTPVTQYRVQVGGATSSTLAEVGPGSAGQVLQSGGAAANPAYSTATYPSTATGTGKILRADGTNWVATTATYPDLAGTSGNVLTSDGTNWNSTAPASTFAPNSTIQLVDDFIGYDRSTSPNMYSHMYWAYTPSNPFTNNVGDSGHIGVIQNPSAASGSGRYLISPQNSSSFGAFILGGGAIDINFVLKIATLSDVTNRYILRFGLGDTVAAATDQANGVYFEYSDNVNSGNWVGKTASGGVRSTANSSTAADTNWHNFKISVNAAATSVSYYIDGAQIANSPLAANIPTTNIYPIMYLTCSAGTMAAGSILWDLFYMQQTLTSAR